ncbi:putative ArsR family transcriptional regulator [Phyllobacterium trifolii]|uniref:Putative ArsR family transcriptional regulator n=1 Tax=Phyllobacterium trifolii TaxID=300193 RepID=A0A839U0S5_9HYPH|nr:metalloregulator ArsR/SmtB family transcription factor [Phyllobacterium trifolii]MBB3144047.1 putative ArsR family transcriptional regulator [Phyllobacterium trifolii]
MSMQDRTTNRMLYSLKVAGAQTASALGNKLGVTSVAVRQMLARLHEDGLVGFEDSRESVGRPKRFWHLTDAGNAQFPDNHAGLTADLLASVSAVFGDAGLDQLISHREKTTLNQYRAALEPIASLEEKVQHLAEIRSAEGYMAEVSRDAGGDLVLIENHCPICVAAKACQKLCRSELEVFQAALGPNVEVKRFEHILTGARRCAYRIVEKHNEDRQLAMKL